MSKVPRKYSGLLSAVMVVLLYFLTLSPALRLNRNMTVYQTDQLYFGLSLVVPLILVAIIRKGWIAISFGAVFHWLILDIGAMQVQILDPERDAHMGDSLWHAFGWIQGLIFSAFLWMIKQFILYLKNRLKRNANAPSERPS